jgi:PAS domain S-box-containing protein
MKKNSKEIIKPVQFRNRLRWFFTISYGLLLVIILAIVAGVLHELGKPLLIKENHRLIEQSGSKMVSDLGQKIAYARSLCTSLAKLGKSLPHNQSEYITIFPELMNPLGYEKIIAGGGIWPEPYEYDPKVIRRSFFWGREPGGNLKYYDDYNDPAGMGYHHEEWYVPARYIAEDRAFWSKSYMDPYSYQPMVTCTVPIRGVGKLLGVATIDLKLEGLKEFFDEAARSLGGYAFAVDRNNKFLSFPDESLTLEISTDSSGKNVRNFIYANDLAMKNPLFFPVARALNNINSDIITQAEMNPNFDGSLTERIDRESYQISREEAGLISAVLCEPEIDGKPEAIKLGSFYLPDDLILGEPVFISIFHMPETHWKIVVTTPYKNSVAVANSITQRTLLYLVITLSMVLCLAFVMLRWRLLIPLKKITSQLRAITANDADFGVTLDISSKDELGELVHWYNRRTTDLADTTRALRESEANYRILFENLQDMFYRSDLQGNLSLVSPSSKNILGYTPKECTELNLLQSIIVDMDMRRILIDTLKETGVIENLELRVRRKDGSVRWVEANAHFYTDQYGEPLGIEGIVRDIADRKEIQIEMEHIRKYLKNIFDSMPSALISTDSDGIVTQWNQAAVKLFGLLATKALGQRIWDLLPKMNKYQAGHEWALKNGEPVEYRREIFENGDTRFHNVFIYPLIANGIRGLVVRLDDITELEMKEEQLRQAQKMETLGTLAGGLAHDFNNVLGGITGTLSILKYRLKKMESVSREELEESIMIMDEAGDRAVDIVQQLLTLSRKQNLSLAPTDLNGVVRNVLNICASTFDKCIELKSSYYETGAMVYADSSQLEQVLLNLCVNASHALTIMSPENVRQGGQLSVIVNKIFADKHFCATHPEAKVLDYWIISLGDTGVGMDVKTVAKMFDPFFTTKDKEKGTGLGMAMVYNIVQQHNGFLDVYSELHVGTTINIYLPVTDVTVAPVEPVSEEQVQHGEGLILVIDDEPGMRKMAKDILRECGYQVIVAEDGFKGLRTFKENYKRIRAVLLDMVMPKLSGKETYIQMKAIDPEVVVVLASGFRQDERVNAILDMGVHRFLQKPYTMQQLAATIYAAING